MWAHWRNALAATVTQLTFSTRSEKLAPKDFAGGFAGTERGFRANGKAERHAKSACLRLFTLIQGHPNWL